MAKNNELYMLLVIVFFLFTYVAKPQGGAIKYIKCLPSLPSKT